MKALFYEDTCREIDRLFENLRRKKEDELQRLLLKCHNESEKKAILELYGGEAT